jgi:hypothetical protein
LIWHIPASTNLESEKFCEMGLDRQITGQPVGQIRRPVRPSFRAKAEDVRAYFSSVNGGLHVHDSIRAQMIFQGGIHE